MKENQRHRLAWVLFLLYLLAMFLLLFRRSPMGSPSYNLQPFKTIGVYFLLLQRDDAAALSFRPYAVLNFIGNLVAFLPLGVFLPLLFQRQRRFLFFLLTATAAVCLVELAQYWSLRGALDVDDLLLNIPGACLGWLGWRYRPDWPKT